MNLLPELDDRELSRFDIPAGNDCETKTLDYALKGAVVGGLIGALQGAFPRTLPKHIKGPLMKNLFVMIRNGTTLGFASGLFACGTCLSAKYRSRDDCYNAIVGSLFSGLSFAIRYRHLGFFSLWVYSAIGVAAWTVGCKLQYDGYMIILPEDLRYTTIINMVKERRDKEREEIIQKKKEEFNTDTVISLLVSDVYDNMK